MKIIPFKNETGDKSKPFELIDSEEQLNKNIKKLNEYIWEMSNEEFTFIQNYQSNIDKEIIHRYCDTNSGLDSIFLILITPDDEF